MKIKLFLSALLLSLCFISFGQDNIKPEFFGTYVVINGKLIEFNKDAAANLSGVGDLLNPTLGIKQLNGPWFSGKDAYFISYGNKNKPVLTKLIWQKTIPSKNSITGENITLEANMWVPNGDIELKIAPIQGMDDCFKLIPSKPLTEGVYCLHFGRLTSKNYIDASVEANADKDVFDFALTNGFLIRGDLANCDIDKGEYIRPDYYGLYFIQDKKYVNIPVNKAAKSSIPEFGSLDARRRGLTEISPIVLESSKLEKTFIAFSNPEVTLSISNAQYKNMIPEKMFLSKLKQIEVDTRSERQIKKGEPEEIQKVWVEDIEIKTFFDLNSFVPSVVRIYISTPLEPGVYAFHNGLLKGQKTTFGIENVIYSFTVK